MGTAHTKPAEEMKTEDFENMIKLNLTSSLCVVEQPYKYMFKNLKGSVINISSIIDWPEEGQLYSPCHASKGAIVNLTRSLANEWGEKGIKVNSIGPTYAKTRLAKDLNANKDKLQYIIDRTPLKRLAEVSEMAGGILFLASDASSIVTGHTLMLRWRVVSNLSGYPMSIKNKYHFAELNEAQIEAVKTVNRSLLVLAGAGTGKTRVLTSRLSYILQGNIAHPSQICTVTFTNKAANEMRIKG